MTTEPMPKNAFLAIFKSTLVNAGYFWSLSIRAIRRMLGKGADRKSLARSVFPKTLLDHIHPADVPCPSR